MEAKDISQGKIPVTEDMYSVKNDTDVGSETGIERDYALTLNEIGEEFNLTRERVRQIKEKAIRRLRHRSRSKTLRNYLG